MQFLTVHEVVELQAERRLLVNRHEAIERSARLAYADILQRDPVEGERATHPVGRPVQNGSRRVWRDDDVDAVQHARVEDTGDRRLHALLPVVGLGRGGPRANSHTEAHAEGSERHRSRGEDFRAPADFHAAWRIAPRRADRDERRGTILSAPLPACLAKG
ncbi:MAG TPA: hypothetical protein VFV95_04540 [Vicinamibacterales bacterium]|nr:hypothetical protein [Vicinamibacterales bacterium]